MSLFSREWAHSLEEWTSLAHGAPTQRLVPFCTCFGTQDGFRWVHSRQISWTSSRGRHTLIIFSHCSGRLFHEANNLFLSWSFDSHNKSQVVVTLCSARTSLSNFRLHPDPSLSSIATLVFVMNTYLLLSKCSRRTAFLHGVASVTWRRGRLL